MGVPTTLSAGNDLASNERARIAAIKVLQKVLPAGGNGVSLRAALQEHKADLSPADRGLMMDLCYGVCRHYRLLDHWLAGQMSKPIRSAAWQVQLILLCGLHELWFSRRPQHAIVSSWPDVCRKVKSPWAVGLTNAVLRKASALTEVDIRESVAPDLAWSLPQWLWQRLQTAWPLQAADIAQHLCDSAPLTVRLHPEHASDLDQRLRDAGMTVTPCEHARWGRQLFPARNVNDLPGFNEGLLSVQDEAAQLPAVLFDRPAPRILDACAAPGGKTGQLAQLFPGSTITAVEVDAQRLQQIEQTCQRLGISVELIQGDASTPSSWWDGEQFDAVLMDVPCSATGIIRRQPDLKWHRRASDIKVLCGLQSRMLDAIWPLIKVGGTLVYATCSILPEENADQISEFLARRADACEDTPVDAKSVEVSVGCQLLPEPNGQDGFFFARLRKL